MQQNRELTIWQLEHEKLEKLKRIRDVSKQIPKSGHKEKSHDV